MPWAATHLPIERRIEGASISYLSVVVVVVIVVAVVVVDDDDVVVIFSH